MPNLPISGLTASATNLAATDVTPVTQTTGVGPVKMTGQQLAGGLLGSTTFNGATITTSQPLLDLSQTWNASGVAFTGLKFNAAGSSNTNSASGSLLMDLQVGGTSQFKVSKVGLLTIAPGGATNAFFTATDAYGSATITGQSGALLVKPSGGSTSVGVLYSGNYAVGSSSGYHFLPASDFTQAAGDLILTRKGAGNLRLGAADAATPVAQTLSVQGRTGTDAAATAYPFTIQGAQGTGTGAGGSIVFQVSPAGGSSNSTPNAFQTVLQITGAGGLTGQDGATANTLALRNGTSAQVFNVYNTYTDASNYEAAYIGWSANTFYITPTKLGTGANRPMIIGGSAAGSITFATSGTNRWQFDGSGNLVTSADNAYDIGASGATRPRTGYFATSFFVVGATAPNWWASTKVIGAGYASLSNYGNSLTTALDLASNLNGTGSGDKYQGTGFSAKYSHTSGEHVWYTAPSGTAGNAVTYTEYLRLTNAGLLTFAGTTSSFPALKRSGAALLTRLADDSADAAFQASQITASSSTANTAAISSSGYSLTGSSAVSMVDLAGTWNTTGVPTAIKLNITNTASGANSLLMDLGTGGGSFASKFKVDEDGNATATGTISAGNYSVSAGGSYIWATRGYISYSADGVMIVRNNVGNDFGRLQFGGTTSSFPALKRSSTTLQARLADDSAFAAIQGKITTDTAYTAGAPTADGYLVIYDSNGTAYKVPAVAV